MKKKKFNFVKLFFFYVLYILFNLLFRFDNLFDIWFEVVFVSWINKVIKYLNEDGFEDGLDLS